MSFVSMFIILTDFGLTTLMVREVSRNQNKLSEYFVNGSFLKVILGILTFGLVRWVSQFVGKPDFYISLILIYCGYAIINNIGEFIRAFFRPSEHMQYEAVLKIINWVLAMVIIWWALYMWYGLNGILRAYLISGILSLIISIIFVIGKQKIDKIKIQKEYIKFSLKIGLFLSAWMLVTSWFLYIDQVVIGFYRTEIELWYYAAAYKIMNIIVLFSWIVANVLYPKIVKLKWYKLKINEFLNKISKFILLFSILFIILNLIISHRLVPFLFWQEYLKAVIPYNILIFAIILSLFTNIFGNLLIIHDREKQYLISVIIALLLNLILNIIFIPLYGIVAAAITTVITEWICLCMYYYFNKKYIL